MVRVYVDTNVLITTMEQAGAAAEQGMRLLQALELGKISGCTSELTLAEVLTGPFVSGDVVLQQAYLDVLGRSDAIEVVAISRSVLIEAARLRAMYRSLRLADAIHLGTAVKHRCDVILTDDGRMPGADLVRRVRLTDESFQTLIGRS